MRAGRLLIVAGAALCACGVALALAVGAMASRAASPAPVSYSDNPNENCWVPAAHVDWARWEEINPDVVAWLEVPGAGISQPVVRERGDAVGFYLTHDVYGSWNLFGCPYVDVECKWPDGRAVYIMGHNISTPPAMFHELVDADLSDGAVLYLPDGSERHLPFLGREVVPGDSYAKRVAFSSAGEFGDWVDGIAGSSGGDVGQVVALCTCSYSVFPGNERTLAYFAVRR